MNFNKLASVLLFSACTATVLASETVKTVTMTRQDAANLYNALSAISNGLSPSDTIAASDNMIALEKYATAYQKLLQAADRMVALVPVDIQHPTHEELQKQIAIREEAEKHALDPVDVTLTLFDVSTDEIKDGKISPGLLSIVRRFLALPKSKP